MLDKRRRLRWNLATVQEDLDYVDDITLLASRHNDIQEKTSCLQDTAEIVGLSFNPSKTTTMRLNCKPMRRATPCITVEGNQPEDVEGFPYLGAILDKQGGTEADIKRRLVLARNTFATLQPLSVENHQSTLQAACQLVHEAGGEVLQCVLIVELLELNGRSKVPAPCFSLVQF
ncbi:hypothetical protein ACROYT_G012027 [Oculina patagonica]